MPSQDGGKEWDCPTCGKDILFVCDCPKDDALGFGDILEQKGYDELDFRDRARQGLASAVVECRAFLTIPEVIQIVLDEFKREL
jgi:hypothetical protein